MYLINIKKLANGISCTQLFSFLYLNEFFLSSPYTQCSFGLYVLGKGIDTHISRKLHF